MNDWGFDQIDTVVNEQSSLKSVTIMISNVNFREILVGFLAEMMDQQEVATAATTVNTLWALPTVSGLRAHSLVGWRRIFRQMASSTKPEASNYILQCYQIGRSHDHR